MAAGLLTAEISRHLGSGKPRVGRCGRGRSHDLRCCACPWEAQSLMERHGNAKQDILMLQESDVWGFRRGRESSHTSQMSEGANVTLPGGGCQGCLRLTPKGR